MGQKRKNGVISLRAVLLLTLLSLGFPLQAQAETYYVDAVNGSDSNDGSSRSSAFRTLQHAADRMEAGDTCIALAGVYDERVKITRSGTDGAPIAFEAEAGAITKGFIIEKADFVHITGFEMVENGVSAVESSSCGIFDNTIHDTDFVGIHLKSNPGMSDNDSSSDCVVRGNTISYAVQVGIHVSGQRHLIEDNEISHTVQCSPYREFCSDADGIRFFGSDHVFRGNHIHDILIDENPHEPHIDCFQTWRTARNMLFEGNLCVNPNTRGGNQMVMVEEFPGDVVEGLTFRNNIFVFSSPGHCPININQKRPGETIENINIVHNLFYHMNSNGPGQYPISLSRVNGATVKNNIVVGFGDTERWNTNYVRTVDATEVDISHNLMYNPSGIPPRGEPSPGDLWMVDPMLTDPTGGDYRPLANSPAIDAGLALSGVNLDFLGKPRPYGRAPDIGPFELGGVANKPPSVNAGADQSITIGDDVSLAGTASDDGQPNPPGSIKVRWSQLSGPGAVSFANPNALQTGASFPEEGTYQLRLSADDSSLETTDELTVTVSPPSKPPGKPVLLGPSGDISDKKPTYTWQELSGAQDYRLWVRGPSGVVVTEYSAASVQCANQICSVTSAEELIDGRHHVRLQAKNSAGTSAWSRRLKFTIQDGSRGGNRVGVPTPISPNGEIGDATPTFTWQEVSDAYEYLLWVRGASGIVVKEKYSAASVQCANQVCSTSLSQALAEGQYSFRMQARTRTVEGRRSEVMSFTVTSDGGGGEAPAAPTPVAPSGEITETMPTYRWQEVSNADDYALWVNGPSGDVFIEWYTGASLSCANQECSMTPSHVLVEGAHTFWVQARNSSGTGEWSQGLAFTVTSEGGGVDPPGAPILLAPSGDISETSPTYRWQEVSNADDYNLSVTGPSGVVVSESYAASSICANQECSIAPAVTLVDGAHSFSVRARNSGGNGAWSQAMAFTVSTESGNEPPGAAILISPSGDISDSTPTYRWQELSNADEYYVSIDGATGLVLTQWYAASSVCANQECSVTPAVTLVEGAHTFTVQARNSSGTGPWSQAMAFTYGEDTTPPPTGTHAYFDELSRRSDLLSAHSMRNQGELTGSAFTYDPNNDTYHTPQDAAKGVIPPGDGTSDANVGGHGSGGQLRLPVNVGSGNTVIYTWDCWWGREYEWDLGGLNTHKAFQIAANVRQPDVSSIWFEVRSHYTGNVAGEIGGVTARAYGTGLRNPILGPGTTGAGGGAIGPQLADFTLKTETWTRFWVELEVDTASESDFAPISLWVADEVTDPVQLLDNVELHSGGEMTEFWWEFNSSQRREVGTGELTLYVRNLVILLNPTDPASTLLERPLP